MAYDQLIPLVYEELRAIAHRLDSDGPLPPTAVVHELYLKLAETESRVCENRVHFFCLAARAMRQILIDRARKNAAAKRGGPQNDLPLHETAVGGSDASMLDLHRALDALEAFDSRKAQYVELRYFAGLQVNEIAEMQGVSTEIIRRNLRVAEAWLRNYLSLAQSTRA